MKKLSCTSAGDVQVEVPDSSSGSNAAIFGPDPKVIFPQNAGLWNKHPIRFKDDPLEPSNPLPSPYKPFVTAEPGQRISITTDIMSDSAMVDVAVKQKNFVGQMVR